MRFVLCAGIALGLLIRNGPAAEFTPAPHHFRQEIARRFAQADGLPPGAVQLIECAPDGSTRAFASGDWYQFRDGHWESGLRSQSEQGFAFPDSKGERIEVPIPWREVRQLLRYGTTNFLAKGGDVFAVLEGKLTSLQWP